MKRTLEHTVERTEGVTIVTLSGDLSRPDQDALQTILDHAARPGCRALVVDLTDVEYIASFAVAAIGYHCKRLGDVGGFFALILPEDGMRKPFRLAGLEQIIPIFATPEEARAAAIEHL